MRTALIRRTPWRALETPAFDRLFDACMAGFGESRAPAAGSTHWSPAVDLEQDEKAVTLRADIPGVNPEDVSVTVEDNLLTLEGERTIASKGEEGTTRWAERASGAFRRVVKLPATVDADKIEARYQNGVVEITCPIAADARPRQIKVLTN